MTYIEKLKKIYAGEQNFMISTFWDAGYLAKYGDDINGFKAYGEFDTIEEAIDFLFGQFEQTKEM